MLKIQVHLQSAREFRKRLLHSSTFLGWPIFTNQRVLEQGMGLILFGFCEQLYNIRIPGNCWDILSEETALDFT